MRIVVSGAAGFIGSHLCDRLVSEGHNVVGMDNLITGSRENLVGLQGEARFEFRERDITERLQMPGEVDAVMHLASPASPRHYLKFPVETMLVNSAGTRNLLDLALARGARFLVSSTSESYGDPLEHPQKETYWGNVNPIGPRSCYDEAKRFSEALTMAYHRRYGLRTTIARIFNTYGPRMQLDDGRVVPAFVDQGLRGVPMTVFGDGSQTRSFCYVADLVDGLYRLLLSDEREPVNLGNPHEMTVLEFARYIQRLTGSTAEIRFEPLPQDDPRRRCPDISKARTVLGWEPAVELEQGLRETIEYFRGRIQGESAA